MNQPSNIAACNVEVDFGRLYWEHPCTSDQFVHLAHEVEVRLGKTPVGEIIHSLLISLASVLRDSDIYQQTPGAIICKTRVGFSEPISDVMVRAYLGPVEVHLNSMLAQTFAGVNPVKVHYKYELPIAGDSGGHTPFEA